MKTYTLETCVDSVESAVAAEKGGATRLELCQNLIIGGTTPSPQLFLEVCRNVKIRIHVLIRPRFGDFCYTDAEFSVMRNEVAMFRELGADGVVIGILHPDGSLNEEQLEVLVKEADGMSVTLHRAFDVCKDPFAAMEQAIRLGFRTILTSGQSSICTKGAELLSELERQSAGRIQIMAGAGVDAAAIAELYPKTGICAYHMSGKTELDSRMEYRKRGVPMGLPSLSEYTVFRTDEKAVRAAKRMLEYLEKTV